MGLQLVWGVESGTGNIVTAGSGTVSYTESTVKRSGAYSCKLGDGAGASGTIRLGMRYSSSTGRIVNGTTGDDENYWTIYTRFDANPASATTIISVDNSGAGTNASVRLNTDGTLTLINGAGTDVATTTATIPLGVQFRIELYVLVHNTTGRGILRLYQDDDDASTPEEEDQTGDFSGSGTLVNLRCNLTSPTDVAMYVDDVAIADDAFYPGRVLAPALDGAGTHTTFADAGTATDWNALKERPFSVGTNSYLVSTGSAGDAETATMESCATTGISGTINAVQTSIFGRDNNASADSGSWHIRRRVGGTNYDTSGTFVTDGTARDYGVIDTGHPGGGAWSTSDIDGMEIGAVENSTITSRFGAVCCEVHFTEAPPAGTFTASGALTAGGAASAGTAEHDPPVFAADGAATAGGAAAASSGTHVAPTFSATGAATVGGTATAGTGTHVAPTFTATGTLTTGGAAADGSALFATAIFSATGALSAGGAAAAATGTHVPPVFTATAALTAGGAAVTGTASLATPATPDLIGVLTIREMARVSVREQSRASLREGAR